MRKRLQIFCLLLLPCLTLAGLLGRGSPAALTAGDAAIPASADNWGLSFPEEGLTPVGNATADFLSQYDAWYVGDVSQKVIYLTFDCGYENGNTEAILDALKKHSAPAAFFVVGHMIESAPDIVRRMAEEGHIVGNHTYHHPDMSAIADKASFQKELDSLAALYQETTGQALSRFYRPPQGKYSEENLKMAQELGYMHIPEGTLISVDELNQYPPEQVVLITTGSQGEPLSALSRMASCSHRQVRVGPGDFIIISANPIPGNEKSVTKIVNGLLLLGAEVIYESMYDVHVSGHACQEEQKLMLTLTRPKYFLPVHGEYKQLKKHALTAASLGIPTSNILIAENGSNVILSRDEIKLGEPVTAGAVMVDGLGVGDVGNVVLRDRKHLSEDGLVIIVATVDSKTGKVLAGPDLVSRGFVYVRENESLMDGAQSIVENALDRCVEEHVRDWNSVKTRVREALSSYIYRRTKRSPMILPILMEV